MNNPIVRTMNDDIAESKKTMSSSTEKSKINNENTSKKPNKPTDKESFKKTESTIPNSRNDLNSPANAVSFSNPENNTQDNKLKDLINRISEQTDKDVDNDSDLNIEKNGNEISVASSLKNDSAQQIDKRVESIKPDNNTSQEYHSTKNNIVSKEAEEKQIDAEILNDIITEDKSRDINAKNKDVADLKKLLDRISNVPSSNTALKDQNKSTPSNNANVKSNEINQKIQENLKPSPTTNETKPITADKLEPLKTIRKDNTPQGGENSIKPAETTLPEDVQSITDNKAGLSKTTAPAETKQHTENIIKPDTISTAITTDKETRNDTKAIMTAGKNDAKPAEVKKEKTSFWKKISTTKKGTSSAGKINELTPSNQIDSDANQNVNKNQAPSETTSSGVLQSAKEKQEENDKKEKTSFWKKISTTKKGTSSAGKINELTPSNQIDSDANQNVNKNQAPSETTSSGVLQSAKEKEEENDKKKKLISNYYKAEYVSPVDRLSQRKQQLYSSLSKRVKLKRERGELDALKNTEEGKNKVKVITKEQEYKQLKKNIKQKYHIKLSLLPWKKIIVLSTVLLAIVGVGYWKLFSIINPSLSPSLSEVIVGEEISEFANIENKLIFAENKYNVTNIDYDAINIFNEDETIDIIKLEIVDNKSDNQIVTFEKALETIGVKNDRLTLPANLLTLTTNSYNTFIFKTNKNPASIRYGIAVKTENADELRLMMRSWEENRIPNQKMIKILKPLFVNDTGFEELDTFFSSVNYSKENIELRYVGLDGSETTIDYFIHKDILVITTSKDSALLMADLLVN